MDNIFTQDFFLGGRIELFQPTDGYRAGIDPLFLAAAIGEDNGSRILDVGVGVGAAALSLAHRCPSLHITGVELQEDLVDLARKNIAHNRMEDRVTILHGDIRDLAGRLESESFDQIMTNPPYYDAENFKVSPHVSKATANVESHVDLEEWLTCCVALLRPKGIFTMIHRAEKGCESMGILRHSLGNMLAYPLWPSERKPAGRVIIQGKKGIKGSTSLLPGMVLHRGDQKYSPEAEAVLRHAQPLSWQT